MSEYTREEMLKMIEEVGGPQNLDLSGKDLSEIDLSREAIAKELEEYQKQHPGDISIWFSEFSEGINLAQANLQKAKLVRANLQEAVLSGANLEKANLSAASLQETYLNGANLQKAHLRDADLRKAILIEANLQEASLLQAKLQEAKLGEANLQSSDLPSANLREAILSGAKLQKANLVNAHLERVDLYRVKSLAGVRFSSALLDQTRMRKEQLGERIVEEIEREYNGAKETYLLLKNNFNQIGRYDDASWAYVKERQMEKMTYHPKLARKYYAKIESVPEGAPPKFWTWWRFYVKYTLKWLWDWIIEWLCGYGERPGRVIGAMFLLLVVAPFAYRWAGGLAHADGRVAAPLDYLVYSFVAFTRIVGTDLVPLTMWGHLVTGLEAFFALLLASLFIYTLGRRISRA